MTPSLQTLPRFYSTNQTAQLTHLDKQGKAKMVDVADKLILENSIKKGDVLTIAEIAGIIGAKKTSEFLPLCHNIALSSVEVTVRLADEKEAVEIEAVVRCEGKTGVEMEALTAVSVAALTVYDMCKAVSKAIVITDVQLVSKSGGMSGDYEREGIVLRDYNRTPAATRFSPFVGPV